MKKYILVFSLIAAILFTFVVFKKNNQSKQDEPVVLLNSNKKDEEIIKIGKKHMLDYFENPFDNTEDQIFEIIEFEDRWKVRSVIKERVKINDKGEYHVIKGGVLFVEFSKDDGRLLAAGVDD